MDPGRLLAGPIDVSKRAPAALVGDFWGEAAMEAVWVRISLDQAGHYHRALLGLSDVGALAAALRVGRQKGGPGPRSLREGN